MPARWKSPLGALEEPRREESQRKGSADDQRRLASSELPHVLAHGAEIGAAEVPGEPLSLEAIMKREKNLLPNVDAYSASTYYMMGIPLDLYTPIFAISRISGWTAHILEQYADNKLIRPRAEYVGPRNVPYVPIDER